MRPTKPTPLERAIELAGGQVALARALSAKTGRLVRQQNIWRWTTGRGRVPAEYVIPVEQVLDKRMTRHELRPDVFPLEN